MIDLQTKEPKKAIRFLALSPQNVSNSTMSKDKIPLRAKIID